MTIYLSIHFGRIIVWQSWIVKRCHSWSARERTNSEKKTAFPLVQCTPHSFSFFSFLVFFSQEVPLCIYYSTNTWSFCMIATHHQINVYGCRKVWGYGDMEIILPHKVLTKFHLYSTFESWKISHNFMNLTLCLIFRTSGALIL